MTVTARVGQTAGGPGTDGTAVDAEDGFTAAGPARFGDSSHGPVGLGLRTIPILASVSVSTQKAILPTGTGAASTSPGSGDRATVIAEDLFNRPEGQVAVDPDRGAAFHPK